MAPSRPQPPKKGMVSPHQPADIVEEAAEALEDATGDPSDRSSTTQEGRKPTTALPIKQPPSDSSKKVEKRG